MSDRAANRLRTVDKTVKSRPEASDGPAVARQLLLPPAPEFSRALEAYQNVLRAVHPLRPKHRASLPQDVKWLSESLTSERGPGPRANYLADPANLSAYLSYFLPWNLLRLGMLFSGLEFDLPDGAKILDLGAGPLTLAQALWMSRPELRGRRVSFVCLDQTGSVLRTGRALFDALAGEAGRAWSFELVQGPLHKALDGPFDLVAAANCLNEAGGGRGQEGRQGLARLAELLARRLAPGGRILLAEPGTRLGGGLLGRMREELLELELASLAPCAHDEPCPLLDPRRRSWCHFTAQAFGSPTWLGKLSKAAGLPKDRLSLSFLFMGDEKPRREERLARVVSSSFALPVGGGVYGCFDQGLAVLTFFRRPSGLESGALVRLGDDLGDERDPKTGAVVVPLDSQSRLERQPAGPEGAISRDVSPEARRDAKSDMRAPVGRAGGGVDTKPVMRTPTREGGADAPRGRGEPKGRDFRRGADESRPQPGRGESGDRAFRRGREESVSRDRPKGPDGPSGQHGPNRRQWSDRASRPDGRGRSNGQHGHDGRDRPNRPDGPDGLRSETRSGSGDRDRAQRPFARPKRRPVSGQGQTRSDADRHRSGHNSPGSDAGHDRSGYGRQGGDAGRDRSGYGRQGGDAGRDRSGYGRQGGDAGRDRSGYSRPGNDANRHRSGHGRPENDAGRHRASSGDEGSGEA